MRVTIIPADGKVVIDGVVKVGFDLSFMADIHAVQWYGTEGEIERLDERNRHSNEEITSLEPFQAAIDAWNSAT